MRSFAIIFGLLVAQDCVQGQVGKISDISSLIQEQLDAYGLDGQGAAAYAYVINSKTGVITPAGVGAAGQRRVGYSTKVLATDLFDVASCGKSFTAALWGVLVSKGYATFSDTIGDILSNYEITVPKLQSQYAKATIAHLLSHRAGFTDNTDFDTTPGTLNVKLKPSSTNKLSPTKIREAFSFYSLAQVPTQALGTYLYSNVGYNIAAWLAEIVAEEAWESQIKQYFFDPLGMKRAGAGLPYKFPPGKTTLPAITPTTVIGHDCDDDNGLTATAYDWEAYSPYGVGSGGLYMTVQDLAYWVAWHIKGLKGLLPSSSPINRAAFQRLHKPWVAPGAENDGNYALGWNNDTVPFGAMWHDGAYAGFRTYMVGVIDAYQGNYLAVAVSTNVIDNGENAAEGGQCNNAVQAILTTLSDAIVDKFCPGIRNNRRRSLAETHKHHRTKCTLKQD